MCFLFGLESNRLRIWNKRQKQTSFASLLTLARAMPSRSLQSSLVQPRLATPTVPQPTARPLSRVQTLRISFAVAFSPFWLWVLPQVGNFSAHNVPQCGFSRTAPAVALKTTPHRRTTGHGPQTYSPTHMERLGYIWLKWIFNFVCYSHQHMRQRANWILSINGIKYVRNKTHDWNAQVKNFAKCL